MSAFVVIRNGCIIECTSDHEVAVNAFLSKDAEGMYKVDSLTDLIGIYREHRDGGTIEGLTSKICDEAKQQTANLLSQFEKLKDSDSARKVLQVTEDAATMTKDIWTQFIDNIKDLAKKKDEE